MCSEVDHDIPDGWHICGSAIVLDIQCSDCGYITQFGPALNMFGTLLQEQAHQRYRERSRLERLHPLPARDEPWPDNHPLGPSKTATPVARRRIPVGSDDVPASTGTPKDGVVYYVRSGNRCKIGFSVSLLNRLAGLGPEELLAVEPGSFEVERRRHRQFSDLHTHREWFKFDDRLAQHCAELRQQHDLYRLIIRHSSQAASG